MASDIDSLVDRYGEENVRKAFWLHFKIKREGIEGIDFTGSARDWMRQIGPLLIKKAIEDEFTRNV
jgi:hypothetical protein